MADTAERDYKRIDPHVHFRDSAQRYKETIAHGMKIAQEQGVWAVCDMPNTNPPITTKELLEKRLKHNVPLCAKGRYFLYMGATANAEQLAEAVECWKHYPEVVGIKMFAGRSVGNLAVIEQDEQKSVYEILGNLNYDGVVAVHCEKESLLQLNLWDYKNPATHCMARPPEAEISSAEDQIAFAHETGFKGHLHICHTSVPETVDLVNKAKQEGMRISCGITPHHAMYNDAMMKRDDWYNWKMNPPLRSKENVEKLRERLKDGMIDWIETDHAPHAVGEKIYGRQDAPSGHPSLFVYREFADEFLPNEGVSSDLIKRMTHDRILEVFGSKLIS